MQAARRQRIWAPAVVLLLLFWLCLPMWRHPGGFRSGDAYRDNDWLNCHSFDLTTRTSLLEHGQIPLRSPWVGGGFPIATHPSDGSWSPTILPILLFGVAQGTRVDLVLALLLGALGVFRLARGWLKLEAAPAWLAAGVVVLSGWLPSVQLVGFYQQFVYLLSPWLLWPLLDPKAGRRGVLGGGLALALILAQGGHAFSATLFFAGLVGWVVCAWQAAERALRWESLLLLLGLLSPMSIVAEARAQERLGLPELALALGLASVSIWRLARGGQRPFLKRLMPLGGRLLAMMAIAGALGAVRVVGLASVHTERIYGHRMQRSDGLWFVEEIEPDIRGETVCDDDIDNDGDGLTDCGDVECSGVGPCMGEDCHNGVDDNANYMTDCADPACAEAHGCEGRCDDGRDGDGDGLIDCDDPECRERGACNGEVVKVDPRAFYASLPMMLRQWAGSVPIEARYEVRNEREVEPREPEYGWLGLTWPGLALLALAGLVAFSRGEEVELRPLRRGLLLLLLVSGICLGWHLPPDLHFLLLAGMPDLGGVDQPLKYFDFFVLLCAALVIAQLAAWLAARFPQRRALLAGAGVALLVWATAQHREHWAALFHDPLPVQEAGAFEQVMLIGASDWLPAPLNALSYRERELQLREYRRPDAAQEYLNIQRNRGTVNWYGTFELPEHAVPSRFVTLAGEELSNPDWRGEAWIEPPSAGQVGEIEVHPNSVEVALELSQPARLVVNQNHLAGFVSSAGPVVEYEGLLAVDLVPGRGRIELRYEPRGLRMAYGVAAFSALGWLLAFYSAGRRPQRRPSSGGRLRRKPATSMWPASSAS